MQSLFMVLHQKHAYKEENMCLQDAL